MTNTPKNRVGIPKRLQKPVRYARQLIQCEMPVAAASEEAAAFFGVDERAIMKYLQAVTDG